MRVVIVDHSHEDCSTEVGILQAAGHEVEVTQVHEERDVIAALRGADAAIAEYGLFTDAVFQALPNLKMVSNFAMGVDNIDLKFTDDAIEEIASVSAEMNATSEDIGARRLHTVMEYLLEDISFNAGGDYPTVEVKIDKKYVDEHLEKMMKNRDLKKYVL